MPRSKPVVSIRRPPAADDFVFAEQSKEEEAKPAAASTNRRGVVTRRDGRELRRVTVYVPADLGKRLAVHCAVEGCDMSEVVTDALSTHLG